MNSHFLTTLHAEHIEGKWWRLSKPLIYYSALVDMTMITPTGFVTDFASVPRLPIAYLFAGNTAHWEAAGHDRGYRWCLLPRLTEDRIFHEAMVVRSQERDNQMLLWRFGRGLRRNVMTTFVVTLGMFSYDQVPGCLDYRFKNQCKKQGKVCNEQCELFYPDWRLCYQEGYKPDVVDYFK